MQRIKNKLNTVRNRLLGIAPYSNITPLKNLITIGSKVHGYHIPSNFLNNKSICYCVGAGDDISFDTELVVRFGAKVFIFDPSPEGINHFTKLKKATLEGQKMHTGTSDPSFIYQINSKQLSEITYIEIGVFDRKDVLKFYKPSISNYESHSIVLFKDSKDVMEMPVDKLSNLMKKLNHASIDVLKLEIEGAEYAVINSIIEDKIDVKIILVEFDEVFHAKDRQFMFRIKEYSDKLVAAGYHLTHSTLYYKRLFVRNDVFEFLKNEEDKNNSTV